MVNEVENKYKLYNGKELNESLGLDLYEMDWRQYDPAIGRFTGIDPITHWRTSTYSAFENNPIYFADPSGASVIVTEGGNNIKFTGEDAKAAFLILTGNNNSSNDNESDEENESNNASDYKDPLSSENNTIVNPEDDIKEYEKNKGTVVRNSMIVDVLSNLTNYGQVKGTIEAVASEWEESTRIIITEEEKRNILGDVSTALTALGITITSSAPQIKVAATLISTPLTVQNVYLDARNTNVLAPRIKRDSPNYYRTNVARDMGESIHYSNGGGGANGGWQENRK